MPQPSVDLNADLGEDGPADEQLLDVVTSTSVACGFHAGGTLVTVRTARQAAARGVVVGAHPSYPDRAGFGRTEMDPPREELVADLVYQIGAMQAAALTSGTTVQFVKPHGALYHRAACDARTAEAVLEAVAALGGPSPLPILCPPGSELARRAPSAGVVACSEAFADRGYAPDGTLLPRSAPGAVHHDPAEAVRQALDLVLRGRVTAADGTVVETEVHSLCVHGDTPGALEMARRIRAGLEDEGVEIAPFLRRPQGR